MNRIILCIVVALTAIAPMHSAWADDPAPTKEQLESAKKAFGEGKALYDAGKFAEAVEKFKESYRLSRNPLLLYNIGHTLDQTGSKDKALFYYRKFLADAPPNAVQRKEVQKRVQVIEKENLEADLAGTSTESKPATPAPSEPKAVKVKPAGTYSQNDFQHQLVDAAPPGKPLDISAFVPEDSGFTVTLYFRGAGDSKFFTKQMKWRYKELVARIPAKVMTGSSIQYYIEVKDQSGATIAKSGKSTSPNLVNIDATATPRFYPDLADDANEVAAVDARRSDDRDDPLGGKSNDVVEDTAPRPEKPAGNGLLDPGSKNFNLGKWASTGVAGGLIIGAGVFFFLGTQQADNLKNDAYDCPTGGAPPCRPFDAEYDLEVQKAGQLYNTLYQVTAVVGVVSLGVAGYFWYKELSSHKRRDVNATKKSGSGETTWAVTPAIGENYAGATAAGRF